MSAAGGTRAIIAALAANLGIALTKFVAFALTGSSSMLAESIHSVADSGNQALLLFGGKRARRVATPQHPFGFGRERYVYAFIVSIVLFSVGGLFALYEGYHKLLEPHPITEWQWVPILVLVIAVGLESYSFHTAIHESNLIRGKATWVQFIRRSRVPELPVVLLEDFAALIGLVLALLGVGLTLITDSGVFDGIGTVLIGLLLVTVAVVLATETKSLLIGESATNEDVAKIEAAIVDGDDIERIIHMRTLHLGPEELLVAVKVGVPAAARAVDVAAAIDAAERRIRAAVPISHLIYIEPDIYHATDHASGNRGAGNRGAGDRGAGDRGAGDRGAGDRGAGDRRAGGEADAGEAVKELTNPVRGYAWGSHTAIATLRRQPVPSAAPEAELWLGAHPSAPSTVTDGDSQIPLTELVAQDPVAVLGTRVVDEFGPRLPYLMKLLAAAQPLSLQAHPDAEQAAEGFAAEQAAGRPADDPNRNYVDGHHKPELLVAIEEFHALCGFRDPRRSADELAAMRVPVLAPVIDALRTGSVEQGLRGAVKLLMAWPAGDRADVVAAVSAHPLAARLGRVYPDDMGVVVALLLNEVFLRPDEAVFMPAGNLHGYLSGFGVEVMAASDNVLRGGLTPKRVDVAQLLRVLRYEVLEDPVVRPVAVAPGLVSWPAPVPDFSLTKAEISTVAPAVGGAETAIHLPGDGPRIVCCLRGPARLSTGEQSVRLGGGDSVFVGAVEPAVVMTGAGAIVFQTAPGS